MEGRRPDHLQVPVDVSRGRAEKAADALRPVTVLFADLVGSTSLGERLPPDEVKVLVGDWVEEIGRIVHNHGGVSTFLGDGLVAFFGLHGVRENDRERAARAALGIVRVTRGYAAEISAGWRVDDFQVRVGMNSGRAITGVVDLDLSGGHTTALGDVVNVAARLQSSADPGTIVVSAAVAVRLAQRFQLEPLGPSQVKGRREPVTRWRLVGEAPGVDRGEAGPFIGRRPERAQLLGHVADLRSGRGQVVLVVGDAGMGKSRIVAEVEGGAPDGPLWLRGACSDGALDAPFRPFEEMLRAWLGLDVLGKEVPTRVRLRARLASLLGNDWEGVFPYLARLLGLRLSPSQTQRLESLPPDVLESAIRRGFQTWVHHLARAAGLVLVIEDLDRAGAATCRLAEDLLEVTDRAPLLLMAAMRPEPASEGWGVRVRALADYAHRTQELRLAPLSGQSAQELVRVLDSSEALSLAHREAVVTRAEGNPLYLEELCRAVVEDPSLLDDEAGTRFPPLPPVLEELLLARIDAVPLQVRQLLQLAAVVGRTFSRKVLQRASGRSDLDSDLTILLRAGLIREEGFGSDSLYGFKHGLVREAALASLPGRRRRTLHRSIAEALKQELSGNARAPVEALAFHYAESDDSGAAIQYLIQAADESLDVDGAVRHLEKAAELARGLPDAEIETEVLEKLARAYAQVGVFARAVDAYERLLSTVEEGPRVCGLLLAMARTHYDAGEFRRAERVVRRTLQRALTNRERAKFTCLAAQITLRENSYELTRRHLDELEDLWEEGLSPDLGFERASVWAGYFIELGSRASAEVWAQEMLRVAHSAANPVWELTAKRNLGILRITEGDVRGAGRLLEEVYRAAQEMGYAIGVLESGGNLLCVYLLTGELRKAEALGAELRPQVTVPFWRASILMNLGTLEFELGHFVEARGLLNEALAVAATYEGETGRSSYLLNTIGARIRLGAVDVVTRDYERAKARLQQALGEAEAVTGRYDLRVLARVWLGELAIRKGDPLEAEQQAGAALDFGDCVERGELVAAWRVLGQAREARNPGTGRDALERALMLAREVGMRLEEARALVALGRCGGAASEELLEAGRIVLEQCGAGRDLAELEATGPRLPEGVGL